MIRGFDVNTGKLLWAFDPGAKDPNAIPSDEHHFTLNSPNSWAPAAYDAKLDLVYLPMGVTTRTSGAATVRRSKSVMPARLWH